MTPNRSLELTCRVQDAMARGTLQFLEPVFPMDVVRSYEPRERVRRRDRVYNAENTLLTMVLTALQPDKSLQSSVRIFQEVFSRNRDAVRREAQALEEQQRRELQEALACGEPRRRGRPRKEPRVGIARSKLGDVSANTGCYSRARERVELGLVEAVFKRTASDEGLSCVKRWHGRLTYNTDGTYFQMQDSPAISAGYRAQKYRGEWQGYPQGLLQVLTQHGSGLIVSHAIGSRSDSELKLMAKQVDALPAGSVLLADALYDCYAFISLLCDRGIDIIVPTKRPRTMRVIKHLGAGDDVVELVHDKDTKTVLPGQTLRPSLRLRRISYPDTEDPTVQHTILTTILDESIDKTEMVCEYGSRWDIEITIREIKVLMGMNISRGQTERMVFKEMGAALIAYNLIRRIVAESVRDSALPPEADLFEELLAHRAATLVDRKGRVYSRWAPGRPVGRHRQSPSARHTT